MKKYVIYNYEGKEIGRVGTKSAARRRVKHTGEAIPAKIPWRKAQFKPGFWRKEEK